VNGVCGCDCPSDLTCQNDGTLTATCSCDCGREFEGDLCENEIEDDYEADCTTGEPHPARARRLRSPRTPR
jgi:hypothetical protein